MYFLLQPWQFYLVILAGWINRQQQQVISYLLAENQVLREVHGKKRIPLTNDQRRRLAVKGKLLRRKMLQEVGNELIQPRDEIGQIAGKIECRERLGGVLRYYYRDAA